MTKKKNSLLTGMIVGGAIGSVLSLLFSSKKNRNIAHQYTKKAYSRGLSTAEKFLKKYTQKNKSKSSDTQDE